MKRTLTAVLTLVAAASATPLMAQGSGRNVDGVPPGQRPPAGMCRIWINGVPPGRQAAPTDCATARANVPANGRVLVGRDRTDGTCSWDRSTNSVGDIIFGRNARDRDRDCDVRRGQDNAWYQRGRDGTYERRHLDANGNWVVERARRDANGNMVITSTRPFGNEGDDSKAWKNHRKAEKRALKEHQKAENRALKGRDDLDHDAMKGAREDLKAHQRAEKGGKGKGKH